MNNNQQDIKTAAIRFFEGCATLDEQARLQQYIDHNPRSMQQFRLWEEEWIKTIDLALIVSVLIKFRENYKFGGLQQNVKFQTSRTLLWCQQL